MIIRVKIYLRLLWTNIKRLYFLLIIFCLMISCVRVSETNTEVIPETVIWTGAYPMAILQSGEYPLWFKLSENGPVYIESIEDAVLTTALVPWPFALHISFLLEKDGVVSLAVNRDGFLRIAANDSAAQGMSQEVSQGASHGLALYRFPADIFRSTLLAVLFFTTNGRLLFCILTIVFWKQMLLLRSLGHGHTV